MTVTTLCTLFPCFSAAAAAPQAAEWPMLMARFRNSQLEKSFRDHESAKLALTDPKVFLFYSQVYFWGYWMLSLREGIVTAGLVQGMMGATVWLVPWLLSKHRRREYSRHRVFWITVHRLINLLLVPTTDYTLLRLPPDRHLKPSFASFVSALVFGSHLSTEWVLSLGLRLDFWWHLALHSLMAVRIAASKATAFCQTPYINNPATLQQFWFVGKRLTEWAGLLLVSPQLVGDEVSKPGAECFCYTLVTSTHLMLAFFLPAVAVWVAEQRSRARFFMAAMATSGEDVAVCSERLGLELGEAVQLCLFDPLTAWVRCLVLLPMLAAITWLTVLGLRTTWAS